MNRDSLITKEKRKSICSGKGYRQKDHETPTGGDTYENSVADDLELFYEDIQLGRRPLSMAWTYFSPELTLNEMELVENKDDKYMRSFKMLNNADVNEAEMKESSSSSKYVSAYCRRKTIKIDSQDFPDANQESNSAKKENKRRKKKEVKIVEPMSITEGKSLLDQTKISERYDQTIKETLFQNTLNRRRGSERRPQSEYNPSHGMRREERRKSKSLQRLNQEAMDLDNFDFKANGTALLLFFVRLMP